MATDENIGLSWFAPGLEWMGNTLKPAQKAEAETSNHIPAARTIARLLPTRSDNLKKSKTVTIAAIAVGVRLLIKAHVSLIASTGNRVVKDSQAVRAAINQGTDH